MFLCKSPCDIAWNACSSTQRIVYVCVNTFGFLNFSQVANIQIAQQHWFFWNGFSLRMYPLCLYACFHFMLRRYQKTFKSLKKYHFPSWPVEYWKNFQKISLYASLLLLNYVSTSAFNNMLPVRLSARYLSFITCFMLWLYARYFRFFLGSFATVLERIGLPLSPRRTLVWICILSPNRWQNTYLVTKYLSDNDNLVVE